MNELKPIELQELYRVLDAGEVDAFMLGTSGKPGLFSRQGADRAYRALVEEMAQGALTLTTDGVIVYANHAMAAMLGSPLESVIGSALTDWFAADARPSIKALLANACGARQAVEIDLGAEMACRVPVYLSVSQLRVEGLPEALCMTVTDLTQQKRAATAVLARENMLRVIQRQHRIEEQLRTSLATLKLHDSALAAISQAVVISDARRRVTYVNKAFEIITGYNAQEVVGQNCKLLQGPDTDPGVVAQLKDCLQSQKLFHGELLNYRKDGTTFWNELSLAPVFDEQGKLSQYVGVQRDVSAKYEAKAEISLAAKVFEQSTEGFVITDEHRRIVRINHAMTRITGFSEDFLKGQAFSRLDSDLNDPEFSSEKWGAVERDGQWEGEVWKQHSDTQSYLHRMTLRKLTNATGVTTHYIASLVDISQQKASEEHIRKLAHYDTLTGLPNRALLQERASYALQMAQRSNTHLTLVFFDVDHFKNINDSLGHSTGDKLLAALAARLQSTLRQQDCLARIGGDEFILILPDTPAQGAAHVAQKILDLARSSFHIDTQELNISVSVGGAIYPTDGEDFDTLASCADAAMYHAKQAGRNTVRFHTQEIREKTSRAIALESALRKALELNQFALHYQPQMCLQTRRVVGVEVLLRWQHPELGAVSPAEFIPVAETSGMILSMGQWVLNQAIAQLQQWQQAGMRPITIAVNLSALQFHQPNLVDLVQQALAVSGLAPHLLELELTESVAVEDPQGAIQVMQRLNQLGVNMAIDDFGTGYSSLGYLKRFRIHKLKIDQSFVRNLTQDPGDQAIVGAIIGMAKSLGLKTIAEGVETLEQLNYLEACGCHEIQGYWLSRPLPASSFRAFMSMESHNSIKQMS